MRSFYTAAWNRPADNAYVMVSMTTKDGREVYLKISKRENEFGHGILTPVEARAYAKLLIDAANRADETY